MAQRLSDIMQEYPVSTSRRLSDVMMPTQTSRRLSEIDRSQSLFNRFGKQYYNVALAAPAQAIGTKSSIGIIKTDVKALKSLEENVRNRYEKGLPLTQQEAEEYSRPYSRWSIGNLLGIDKPEWQQRLASDYQTGNVVIKKPETQKQKISKLQTTLDTARVETAKKADISFAVSEAENWKEKGVDVIAGISGFVSQLAALKKAFPQAPPVFIWELQNQVTGGAPGKGALTYGAFAAPGKLIKGVSTAAKVGRVASESVLLGGMSAAHQKIETGEINASEVLISAGIPLGLRAVGGAKGALKRALKAKNPKAIKAVNEAVIKVEAIGLESANKKLLDSTAAAKKLSKTEVKAAHKALRRRQAGRGIKATKAAIRAGRPAGEAIRAGRRAYGVKAKVPKITPPDLTDAQWEGYHKKILEIYPLKKKGVQFQRTNTQEALNKLRAGDIPTNYDFGLLDKLLGRETTLQLHANLAKHRTYGIWDVPVLTRDMLKSMFGWDPQAWRQLAGVSQRHPVVYAQAAKANIQAYASKIHTNRINKAIETSPNYKIGTEKMGVNYLGTTPWSTVKEGTRLQQYGTWTDFLLTRKNRVLNAWGRGLAASERGANAGMNTGLNGLVGSGIKDLELLQSRLAAKGKPPMTAKQIDKYLLQRGHDINALTKRVTAKNPKAKEIQRAANWILFSSAHTVSRPIASFRSVKNLMAGKGLAGRTYAAQVTASNIAKLSLLSSVGAYVGHKWRAENPTEEPKIDSSMNPLNSMWGKYRVGNDTIDLSGGDNSTYRLLARIGVSAILYGQKAIIGKEQTEFAGWRVKSPGEEIKRYFNSRETVLLGLAKTLATGKDWLGNPIGRKEAILKQFPMEFLVSVVEAGNADGMWEAMSQGDVSEASKDFIKNLPIGVVGLMGAGTATYPVKTATTRYKFRDIVAKGAYNKEWSDLTLVEQRKLSRKHRKAFDTFERKIKAERLEEPGSFARIQEEQYRSGVKITKLLSKANRQKIEGVSVQVSRRPKNFYLNDERYQRYQELTAKYLNERLSKIKLEGRSDAVRDKLLEIAVRIAKNKAFRDIRKEMK